MACDFCRGMHGCPCCADGQAEAEARQEAEEMRAFRRDVRRGICGHDDCNSPRLANGDYCAPCQASRDGTEATEMRRAS